MKRINYTLIFSTVCIVLSLQALHAESTKLIRHFTFDEGFAESVYGNEATRIIGNPTLTSGISGQGVELDGNSALAYDDYFDLHLEQFTLTAWVKPKIKNHAGNIAGKGSDIYWIFYNHGEIKSGFYDHKFHECYSGLYLEPDQWYFLAITYDGKTLRGYINHHLDSIKQVQSKPRKFEGPFIIGAEGVDPSRYFFNGTTDEVRLYDGPLSTSDLLKLYKKHSTNAIENE